MNNPYDQGRLDYEADVRARPCYHDGKPRPRWPQLDTIARGSWARGPSRFGAPSKDDRP